METNQTDSLLSSSGLYSVDSFKLPPKPRFINRGQNLYSVYQNNSDQITYKDIGRSAINYPNGESEVSNRIDLVLPGGDSKNISRALIKKPFIRTLRALSLRLIATCVYIGLIGASYLLIQNFLNLQHVIKEGNKSVAVIQNASEKEAAAQSNGFNSNIIRENAPVLILNGTPVQGQAAALESSMRLNGYNIIGIGNAPTTDFSQTVLFDLSKGKDANTLSYLEQQFDTTAITMSPGNSIQTNGAAFVIIIGSNESINSQD